MSVQPLRGGVICRRLAGGWRGVLIQGPSGAGKSDLALRALAAGWRLVSDDYSVVWASGGRLWARAPERIADRIEVRGLGIVHEPARVLAPLSLVVECVADEVDRLPDAESIRLYGLELPKLRLQCRHESALAKLDRALATRGLGDAALGTAASSAYLARSPDMTSA